jgi:hypothetical protein
MLADRSCVSTKRLRYECPAETGFDAAFEYELLRVYDSFFDNKTAFLDRDRKFYL